MMTQISNFNTDNNVLTFNCLIMKKLLFVFVATLLFASCSLTNMDEVEPIEQEKCVLKDGNGGGSQDDDVVPDPKP